MIEVCSCITLYPVRACAPIAGPVGLTARGRPALLAGGIAPSARCALPLGEGEKELSRSSTTRVVTRGATRGATAHVAHVAHFAHIVHIPGVH